MFNWINGLSSSEEFFSLKDLVSKLNINLIDEFNPGEESVHYCIACSEVSY